MEIVLVDGDGLAVLEGGLFGLSVEIPNHEHFQWHFGIRQKTAKSSTFAGPAQIFRDTQQALLPRQ
jgi:hypothetical protein